MNLSVLVTEFSLESSGINMETSNCCGCVYSASVGPYVSLIIVCLFNITLYLTSTFSSCLRIKQTDLVCCVVLF